jgi:DNA-binding CsgD family transcriptional regulator
MATPVTASERDLRALAGIVSQDRSDLPEVGLPPSLLADLMGQIRCDVLSFVGVDVDRQVVECLQVLPTDDVVDDQALWEHYWGCKLVSYPDRTGDLCGIVKIADFYSARQWRSTGMYRDYFRSHGIEHLLVLCLPAAPGQTAKVGQTLRLIFHRGPGPDFSERDRAVLTLLRPHLGQAYLDAERCRHPVPRLTPRQKDLVRLLAAGHTNTQIARRLGISEGTVRTHLENIYERLQVSSRTAAVTRAFPDQTAWGSVATGSHQPSRTGIALVSRS